MPEDFKFRRSYWNPKKFFAKLEQYAQKNGFTSVDIGCGRKRFLGSTGVDERHNSLADVHHDLNTYPYPLESDKYDIVVCRHVLEHMDNIPATMEELYRIAKPDGYVVVEVPHFTHPEAFRHWQHKHFFTLGSLDYFSPGNPYYKTALHIFWRHIYIHDFARVLGLEWFMNRHRHFYERHLAFILQAASMIFMMKAVKPYDATVK